MIDNYEADIVLTDDELTNVGAEIPIIQHGLVIDNIIENAKNWNNQVRIFIRDERELQNYYQGLRTQNYLVNDAVEYFTQYYFDLKNGNKKTC